VNASHVDRLAPDSTHKAARSSQGSAANTGGVSEGPFDQSCGHDSVVDGLIRTSGSPVHLGCQIGVTMSPCGHRWRRWQGPNHIWRTNAPGRA